MACRRARCGHGRGHDVPWRLGHRHGSGQRADERTHRVRSAAAEPRHRGARPRRRRCGHQGVLRVRRAVLVAAVVVLDHRLASVRPRVVGRRLDDGRPAIRRGGGRCTRSRSQGRLPSARPSRRSVAVGAPHQPSIVRLTATRRRDGSPRATAPHARRTSPEEAATAPPARRAPGSPSSTASGRRAGGRAGRSRR